MRQGNWKKVLAFCLGGIAIAAIILAIAASEMRCSLFRWPACPQPVAASIPLVGSEASAVGANYTQLARLLARQQWKAADRETLQKMLEVKGKTEKGYLEISELQQFPCPDLRTLDRLWSSSRQGRFGLSKQQQILRSLPQKPNEKQWEIDKHFAQRVQWDRLLDEGVIFNSKAVEGHLPSTTFAIATLPCCRCGIWKDNCWPGFLCACGDVANLEPARSLFSRLEQCRLALK
jgi:GUN4-like